MLLLQKLLRFYRREPRPSAGHEMSCCSELGPKSMHYVVVDMFEQRQAKT